MMLWDVERIIGILERQRRVLELQDHLDHAEAERLSSLRTDIHILKAAVATLRRNAPVARTHPRQDLFNPNSNIATIVTILKDAGEPLHVREIIRRAQTFYGRTLKRGSITPRLGRLARDGRMFKQYAPAVYGLIQWPKDREELIAAQSIADTIQELAAAGGMDDGGTVMT